MEAAAAAGGEVCHDPPEGFEIEIEIDVVRDIFGLIRYMQVLGGI
jgi:hypothetical protein